ncbi:hypothetical protein ACFY8P_13100 [Streptomyces sp. NPDC012693]|uniref:hypothetical protein n=1 Tax=unclassified Streptomyces TaxID=2593676 RepID=UPI00202F496A|nr:hypothetical protein [Streptomyces sp. MSC1_001]
MPAAYTTLDLAPAVLPDGAPPWGSPHPRPDGVDLVVDGRQLLHRLDEADGTDAVSPLAADLPPILRAEHVRRLLDPAPSLADGRQVIHSCPDCADPGCGAVTAVVERAGEHGEDIVWRDFAWQTGPTADPREGYPGVGPFRFHGAAYRDVLLRLLDASARRSGQALEFVP